MSIAVPLDELPERLPSWGAAALITSSPNGARVVTLYPIVDEPDAADAEPRIRFAGPGRSAIANVANQSAVTLYFAADEPSSGYSLIVDGAASVHGDDVVVVPTSAVLHRPPPAT